MKGVDSMAKLSSTLFKLSRTIAKASSMLRDAELISKGDVKGLVKKKARSQVYKNSNGVARSINKYLK